MEKKSQVSEQNFTKGKALQYYAVLCNVQNWVSWLRISKNEKK